MKKSAITGYTIVCCAAIILSGTMLFTKQAVIKSLPITSPYYLRDYKGKVALYNKTSNEQVGIYDIYTHLLPQQDYEMLKVGIDVDTPEELSRVLEDLGL